MLSITMIRNDEIGLVFRDGEFRGLQRAGWSVRLDLRAAERIERVSLRAPQFVHEKLDLIVRSGALAGLAEIVDVQDRERALVWVDGRFALALAPGLHAFWTTHRKVRVEKVEVREPRFDHAELVHILRTPGWERVLDVHQIEPGRAAALFIDGRFVETLQAGRHAFWKNAGVIRLLPVDLREAAVDVNGQDVMTADQVTLRLNALVVVRIVDVRAAVTAAEDLRQALHREAQLALRAVIGGRSLDELLAAKDAASKEMAEMVRARARELGLEVVAAGIRDVILPGEIKELLNKVVEARKAAEATLIQRREETAAIRSQANTARMLQENPLLLRLRELETLERVAAAAGELKILTGDKGLLERVTNLL